MNKNTPYQNGSIHLDIDSFIQTLDTLAEESNRITRKKMDETFLTMRSELPNASHVITSALAAVLLVDSPHAATDTTLNNIVISLGKILCNPSQTEALTEAMQVYYHARKITEKEYAAEIANEVLENNDLKGFPESARSGLQELSLAIMEKIINEKLSRRTPGYKSHSILELVNPYLHYKLANPELERLKLTSSQAFRTWITNIGQEGYEKINNEKKFTQIQREKEAAFNEFKKFIGPKTPNKAALAKLIDKIRISQIDRQEKHNLLADRLDSFLTTKSILGKSALELRQRFHNKLRKLFNLADQNPDLFRNDVALLDAHEDAFNNVENDISAIKKIILTIADLEKNYNKSLLNSVLGRSNLNTINASIQDVLLGPLMKRRELSTGRIRIARDGGYPQKNLLDLYDSTINQLQINRDMLKGAFSTALKQGIESGINDLEMIKGDLKTFSEPHIVTKPTLVPPLPPESVMNDKTPHVTETPKIKLVATETVMEKPVVKTPQVETSVEAPIVETVASATAENVTAENTSPAPEKTEEPHYASIKVAKADTKNEPRIISSLLRDEFKPTAKVATGSAMTAEYSNTSKINPKPTPAAQENLAVKQEPQQEQAETKPDEIEEDFTLEPIKKAEPAAPTALTEPGFLIMKNYQLGEFENPIQEAWKNMVATAEQSFASDPASMLLTVKDNEIQLYVICDLLQQVAAIDSNRLNEQQKEILQSIRAVLLAALANPLEENNWSCFEGIRRDDIDRAIAALQV